jgi:Transposase, Mutator family
MRRKRKSLTPDAPLAPVPSEILDQFVGQGPISSEELDAAVRQTEGAKFWMKAFSHLKTRGCEDNLIAVTDGLKGDE